MNKKKIQKTFREWALDFKVIGGLGRYEKLALLISNKYALATKDISNEAKCVLQHIHKLKNKK